MEIDNLINGTATLRTEKEVDELLSKLKTTGRRIDNNLDLAIRMSMHKVKIQKYYEAKLKDANLKIVSASIKNENKETPQKEVAKASGKIKDNISVKKSKKKKIKFTVEEQLVQRKPVRSIKRENPQLLFCNTRTIDILVKFIKDNIDDFNAVIEQWIRKNISNNVLKDYYKDRMSKEIPNYRSIASRMLTVNVGKLNERMEMRIKAFHKKLASRISELSSSQSTDQIGSSQNKQNITSFEITQEKEWVLDWNCVTFKRGSVVIFSRSDLDVKFKPTEVYAAKSLESFNYLRKYLNERLEPVRCIIKAQNLIVIDKINFDKAILQFAAAAHQGIINLRKDGGAKITPIQKTFNQALSEGRKMTLEDFKKYKSHFIDYLIMMQSRDYKVIPCAERLAHANSDTIEYSFIFTLESKTDMLLIVHENINIDRSTLLFLVKKDGYNKTIREIYDFLQSPEVNKRSGIRERSMDIKGTSIVRYKSINHDEVYSWKNAVSMFAKYGI